MHADFVNNSLAQCIIVRRFQPPTLADIGLIQDLCAADNRVVIGIQQPMFLPNQDFDEHSKEHPALNPFSFWERYTWLSKILQKKFENKIEFVPFPFYCYEYSHPNDIGIQERLWMPENIRTYLPEHCDFVLIDDDDAIIYCVQNLLGEGNLRKIPKSEVKNYIGYEIIQEAMLVEKDWKVWIPTEIHADIESFGISRIRYLASKYQNHFCVKHRREIYSSMSESTPTKEELERRQLKSLDRYTDKGLIGK